MMAVSPLFIAFRLLDRQQSGESDSESSSDDET